MPYSVILDVLFAALLIAALVYMARLNRRLDALRAGREEFEALIKRFTAATEQAQGNVAAMKEAADSTGKGLQAEIDRARGLREDLAFLADRANALADQLETAITRSRPAAGAAGPPAGGMPAGSNIARMPLRAEEPRADAAPARPQPGRPQPGAGATLSSSENELLRRLSTLR
jgi:hypothetical protein